MSALQDALDETSQLLHDVMDGLLPDVSPGKVGESRLAEAMRYTTLAPGKRLRPFLVIMSANLFGVSNSASSQVAAAIEFVHAYSLIHDDLPAMDNDDTRRNQPSSHKKFDEATAILAGDALLTLAFEILAHESTHPSGSVRAELVYALAKASGAKGMLGGQMIDLISEDRELNIGEINRLQRMKTGSLFALACESGAILGKAPTKMRNALRGYAQDIGLAFQITDDILDAEVAKNQNDNDPIANDRRDKSSGKGTFVSAMGLEQARRQAMILSTQAITHLDVFGSRADHLRELADFVVHRKQ